MSDKKSPAQTKATASKTISKTAAAAPAAARAKFDLAAAVKQTGARTWVSSSQSFQIYMVAATDENDVVLTDPTSKANVLLVSPPASQNALYKDVQVASNLHSFPNHMHPYYNGAAIAHVKLAEQYAGAKDARGYLTTGANKKHLEDAVTAAVDLLGKPTNVPNFTTAADWIAVNYRAMDNETRCLLVEFKAGNGVAIVTNERDDENVADFVLVSPAPDTRQLKFCVNMFAYRNIVRRTVLFSPNMPATEQFVYIGRPLTAPRLRSPSSRFRSRSRTPLRRRSRGAACSQV